MKTRIYALFILAFATAFSSLSPVNATTMGGDGVTAGPLSIGGRGTYFKPKDADGHWYGGAQLRWHLSPVIALEGSADYRRDHFGDTRVDTYPVQASLLLYLFPNSPVTPFILGGGGWYYTHTKGPGGFDNTQNRFGPHAGAGLQWFMNQYWSIDGTYRYTWVEDIQSKDASLVNKNFNGNGYMVTGALNLHFGGGK